MSSPTIPPQFVPTLTEVVKPHPDSTVLADKTARSQGSTAALEEQIVQRVLQRVDLMLDRRLRESVGQLILAHTENLAPRLREEIELLVRQSVSQALAQEEAK